jgi:hypothetical protein
MKYFPLPKVFNSNAPNVSKKINCLGRCLVKNVFDTFPPRASTNFSLQRIQLKIIEGLIAKNYSAKIQTRLVKSAPPLADSAPIFSIFSFI